MERIGSAFKLALRSLGRSPGFAAVVVLTLAAGVGANTAIFSLANWALLRPVPGVADPDGLVTVEVGRADAEGVTVLSHPTVLLFDEVDALTSVTSYSPFDADVVLSADARPLRVAAQIVTPGFFETLGVRPERGRTFSAAEGHAGTVHRVAVISHAFWRETLDGDDDVLGRTLDLNGSAFTVVGVAPAAFRGPGRTDDVDLWVPASAAPAVFPRFPANLLSMDGAPLWLRTAGRLAPGATREALTAQLSRTAPGVAEAGNEIRVLPGIGLSTALRSRLTATLSTLAILVSLLLALTIANLINLVLSRVSRRRHEASVRKALGASGWHLTADLAAEGGILALLGSLAAVATGWGLLRLLEGTQVLAWLPRVTDVPLDVPVLLFSLAAAAASVGAAAVMGATRIQRFEPRHALGHRDGSVGRPRLLRRGLVSAQVAISLALVVAAGLVARSLDRLVQTELGFDPTGVVTFSLNPGVQGYDDIEADRLFRELTAAIGERPGVDAVGFSWLAPLGPRRYAEEVRALGRDAPDEVVTAQANMVTPGFFAALDLPLREGRTFDDREYERSERPTRGDVVLNRTLAERLFPGADALGREIRMDGREETSFEVIGVVDDARLGSVQEPAGPTLFDPFGNGYRTTSATFVVRTGTDPEVLLADLESIVRERDPRLPVLEPTTLTRRVTSAVSEERALGRLLGVFALLSLLLAAAGLFGLVSESVQARTREFGIRTALGAASIRVAGLVLRESLVTVGAGAVSGLLLARWTGSLLESRLFGLPALDPASFAGATLVLGAAVLLASLGPAWRSARIGPAEALRAD